MVDPYTEEYGSEDGFTGQWILKSESKNFKIDHRHNQRSQGASIELGDEKKTESCKPRYFR